MKTLAASIGLSLLASAASAQSPYAGMQSRPIKALSEQQIADLKTGRGMGLALTAELKSQNTGDDSGELDHRIDDLSKKLKKAARDAEEEMHDILHDAKAQHLVKRVN